MVQTIQKDALCLAQIAFSNFEKERIFYAILKFKKLQNIFLIGLRLRADAYMLFPRKDVPMTIGYSMISGMAIAV